jgi:hypothetical protein
MITYEAVKKAPTNFEEQVLNKAEMMAKMINLNSLLNNSKI